MKKIQILQCLHCIVNIILKLMECIIVLRIIKMGLYGFHFINSSTTVLNGFLSVIIAFLILKELCIYVVDLISKISKANSIETILLNEHELVQAETVYVMINESSITDV